MSSQNHTQWLKKEVILDVQNLSTHFFTSDGVVEAVDDVSFKLHKGEILGLVGESGCGKSVTVMSLLQLIPQPPGEIVNGSVLFEGKDLITLSRKELQNIRGNRISMIFQDPMTSLNPYMKVSAQIMETLIVHKKMNKSQAHARAVELLRMVGIQSAEKRADHYPHEFSGGMRQRVMIAMALACDPEILIADEPTTALDVSVQIQILGIIKEMAQKLGVAVIFITHDLGVVANLCDRVHVMYAGRIVEEADVDDLFSKPAHPYTQGLIDSVTQLHGKVEKNLRIIEGQPPILINMPEACLFYPRCKKAHDRCIEGKPPKVAIQKNHHVECVLHDGDDRKTRGAQK